MTFKVPSQDELDRTPFYFGKKEIYFYQKQFELCFAPETEIAEVGGYGTLKTVGGICRATRLSTWYPGNLGIIGRFASTDLAATTQKDCLEFWEEANLLDDFVDKGKYKIPTATLKCVDPYTQEILKGKYSEVLFAHLDDPTHTHGHHTGFNWLDEGNETVREAWDQLMSRMRRKGFAGLYSQWVTSNTNKGREWIYDHFFDPLKMAELKQKRPAAFAARRAIHVTTYEVRKYLPPNYIENMENSYSEKMVKVYLGGSYDNFEGQIFEDFDPQVHVFSMRQVFPDGIPERWNRLLGVDVGGSDPWAWEWAAVDPHGNVIVYDEIYRPGTRVAPFANEAINKIKPYRFQARVIDYENKVAAGELAEYGITFTNAKKMNKNDSIFRLNGYLHPNPQHAYPSWHPKAGQSGSPRVFVSDKCANLIKELPQQRWHKPRGAEAFANVPDPNVADHASHALLYMIRELPKPTELEKTLISDLRPELSLQGKIMNHIRRNAKEENKKRLWNAHLGHGGRHSGRRIPLRGVL